MHILYRNLSILSIYLSIYTYMYRRHAQKPHPQLFVYACRSHISINLSIYMSRAPVQSPCAEGRVPSYMGVCIYIVYINLSIYLSIFTHLHKRRAQKTASPAMCVCRYVLYINLSIVFIYSIYIHTYIYIYMYIYTHTRKHTYLSICTCTSAVHRRPRPQQRSS